MRRRTCLQVKVDDAAEVEEVEGFRELQQHVSAAVLPVVEVAAPLVVQRVEEVPRHLLHHQQHRVSLHSRAPAKLSVLP